MVAIVKTVATSPLVIALVAIVKTVATSFGHLEVDWFLLVYHIARKFGRLSETSVNKSIGGF